MDPFARTIVGILLCTAVFSLGQCVESRHTTEAMALTDTAIEQTDHAITQTRECLAAWLRAAADKRATTPGTTAP